MLNKSAEICTERTLRISIILIEHCTCIQYIFVLHTVQYNVSYEVLNKEKGKR